MPKFFPSSASEDEMVDLQPGLLVAKRWKVIEKLGEGGCGCVYKVMDVRMKTLAALKAESLKSPSGCVLKLEVQILTRLKGRRCIPTLLQAGKKPSYTYMVTTLLGPSLEKLMDLCGRRCSMSSQIRVGIQMLFGLKQLHEIGFVHRDVKPANLAVGLHDYERIFHVLDFGLAREFVVRRDGGRLVIRRARRRILFRGTTHYCSVAAHKGYEQGRVDDLWSMLYVMIEMRSKLPWDRLRDGGSILEMKVKTSYAKLLSHSPCQLIEIPNYLRGLNYYSRPSYSRIFRVFTEIMEVANIKYDDPYDWDEIEDRSLWNMKILNIPKTIIERVKSIGVVEYTGTDPTVGDTHSDYTDSSSVTSPARTPRSPRTARSPRTPRSPLSCEPTPSSEYDEPLEPPDPLADLFEPEAFSSNELGL